MVVHTTKSTKYKSKTTQNYRKSKFLMVARYVKAFKMKACKVQAEMTELLEKIPAKIIHLEALNFKVSKLQEYKSQIYFANNKKQTVYII